MTSGRLLKKEIERRERIQQKKDLFEKLKNKANKLLDSDSMGVSEGTFQERLYFVCIKSRIKLHICYKCKVH